MPPIITPIVTGASEREQIITPYIADVFEQTLHDCNLLDEYASLPNKLRYGFPIGDFEIPTFSFTPHNHPSGVEHMDFINSYVQEQVAIGRMTGPYSQTQVESILGGFFVSSPLSVVDKASAPGKFRLIQNCSYKDANKVSVNDQIDSDNFPTKWGTASQVAELVSPSPFPSGTLPPLACKPPAAPPLPPSILSYSLGIYCL